MRRNISIDDEAVNTLLDEMPKGSRSNYIKDCILFKVEFDNDKYIKKDLVYQLIEDVIKYMGVNNNVSDVTTTNDTIEDSLKSSILNILNIQQT